MDNTLLYSNHIPILLHYFSSAIQVFTKYRLSFKFNKYNVFLSHVEYVGHNLTANGNCFLMYNVESFNRSPASATRLIISVIMLFPIQS